MRIISYFFLIIFILLGVLFAVLNSEAVTINYYFKSSTLPLSLLLVIVFASGCLLGMIVEMWLLIKSKLLNRRLKQQLALAKKEIQDKV